MKILLLSSLTEASGNQTTATKIAEILRKQLHEVLVKDANRLFLEQGNGQLFEYAQNANQTGGIVVAPSAVGSALGIDLASTTRRREPLPEDFDFAIGIHAYRSGRFLLSLKVPYLIVLGGTDMNEYTRDAEKAKCMREVLEKAKKIVAFHPELARLCTLNWPSFAPKMFIIPPSPYLPVTHTLSDQSFSLRKTLKLSSYTRIFLLPVTLRPVKDPAFLIEAFSQWRTELLRHQSSQNSHSPLTSSSSSPSCSFCSSHAASCRFSSFASMYPLDVALILLGHNPDAADRAYTPRNALVSSPVLASSGVKNTNVSEGDFSADVLSLIDSSPGVYFHSSVPISILHHVLVSECEAVVNTSISEGLSNSLLEAMALGVPVIARRIPGNVALIQDSVNGLLFSTCEEFFQKVNNLLTDHPLRENLVTNAKLHIKQHFSMEKEEEAWKEALSFAQ